MTNLEDTLQHRWCREATEQVAAYVRCLREGGVLLYPTDTVWGLGCDARNAEAVSRITALKGREPSSGYLMLLDSYRTLERWVGALECGLLSLQYGCDRPVSVVYPSSRVRGERLYACAQDGSAGFRVVRHRLCKELVVGLGAPLVSTSANLSHEAYRGGLACIPQQIREGVDMVVNPMFDTAERGALSSVIVRARDEKAGWHVLSILRV